IQTKQFASLGQKELKRLAALDTITDIALKIHIANILYGSSPNDSEEKQLAIQMLLQLAQHLDLSVEHQIKAAQALYESSSSDSEEQQLAIQILWQLAQDMRVTADQRLYIVTIPITEGDNSFL